MKKNIEKLVLSIKKKLFGRKSETGIMRLCDITNMPKLDDLEDTNLYVEYKNKYVQVLNENKTYTSADFDLEDLKGQVEMYTGLLTRACYDESLEIASIVNFKNKQLLEKKVDLELLNIKLRVYMAEIKSIIEKVKCLLVAFDEIRVDLESQKQKKKNKIFYLNNIFQKSYIDSNISTIVEIINQLINTKVIVENMYRAASLTMETALKNIQNILNFIDSKGIMPDKKFEKEVVLRRRKRIRKDVAVIDDLEEVQVKKKKAFITVNEVALEKYVYSHKDKLQALRDEVIKKLSQYDFEDLKKELKWVKKAESVYKVFSRYGRDIVSRDDLIMLYYLKFEILTSDLNNLMPIFPCNGLEEKVYEEIIFDLIDNILNDRLNKLDIFGSKKGQAVSLIEKILKDGRDKFIPQKIVQNEGFILLLYYYRKDFESFMEEFLEEKRSKTDESLSLSLYNLIGSLKIDSWFEGKIEQTNYKTVFKLIEWNKTKGIFSLELSYLEANRSILYNMYLLNCLYESINKKYEEYYFLPCGITQIDSQRIQDKLYKKINQDSSGKVLVFPKTLKSITSDKEIFSGIVGIVINDELEEIPDYIWAKVKKIEFRDYLNSKILHSEKWLDYFLRVSIRYVLVDSVLKPDEHFLKMNLAVLNIDELVLSDEAESVTLNKEDLQDIMFSCIFDIQNHHYCIPVEMYECVLKSLKEKVNQKRKSDFVKHFK